MSLEWVVCGKRRQVAQVMRLKEQIKENLACKWDET